MKGFHLRSVMARLATDLMAEQAEMGDRSMKREEFQALVRTRIDTLWAEAKANAKEGRPTT